MSSFYRKDNNEFYDKSTKWKILGGVSAAFISGFVIIALVFALNQDTLKNNPDKTHEINKSVATPDETADISELIDDTSLTADDLDFWDLYDNSENESTDINSDDFNNITTNSQKTATNSINQLSGNSLSLNEAQKSGDNKFNIGNSTNPEYIETNNELAKNTYVPGSFRLEGNELSYYDSNRKASSYGIDVSKYQGSIDWQKVASQGVSFAMIRMGVRGYNSGSVVLDEKFTENMVGAIANGIDVGIYFYSQATTEAEAIEEANYAVAAVQGYAVTYPIVFYTESITTDVARTDNLDPSTLTTIANAFCQNVENYGYKSMIAGNKSQLATKLNLSDLSNRSFYLIDPVATDSKNETLTMSDYPYQYNMWQYSSLGKIDGINGDVNLDISFVDYKYR